MLMPDIDCYFYQKKRKTKPREVLKSEPLAKGPEAYHHQIEDATLEALPSDQQHRECVDTYSLQF